MATAPEHQVAPGQLGPWPDRFTPSLEGRVGPVELRNGLPTPKGIQQLFAIQDFQRATQLYQWAIPAVGTLGWHRASIANGKSGETDWVMYADIVPIAGILTPTAEVSYVMNFPDLLAAGPLVLDYAPGGIVGMVMDYWQRPHFDYGLTGPEKGTAGGKALLLGPGQDMPPDADGYHVVRVPTRFAFMAYRVLDPSEKDKLTPLNRLYPFAERNAPKPPTVITATKDYIQSQPRGFAYWEAVNEIVQREVVEDRDRFFYAMLRDLGIEKGRPFDPSPEQRQLLEDAALLGEHIQRVKNYEQRHFGQPYRQDAGWQFAPVPLDPGQREDNYDQLDERSIWSYEAIGTSYFMVVPATTPGVGSAYLSTYRDKDGDWLDGAKPYHLHVAANPPMKQFWSVAVYDMDSRTLYRNETLNPEISSNSKGLQANADGSVDVYFGPTAPTGKESNWVQTAQGHYWFPYFRLYAPTEHFIDRSWALPDIEKA